MTHYANIDPPVHGQVSEDDTEVTLEIGTSLLDPRVRLTFYNKDDERILCVKLDQQATKQLLDNVRLAHLNQRTNKQ